MAMNRVKILLIAVGIAFAQHGFAAGADINEKTVLDSVVKSIQEKIKSSGTLDLSTLSLPPVSSKDPQGRMGDRLFLLEEGVSHLERRFRAFLHLRSENPEGLQEEMRDWIRGSLQGAGVTADEVPWES